MPEYSDALVDRVTRKMGRSGRKCSRSLWGDVACGHEVLVDRYEETDGSVEYEWGVGVEDWVRRCVCWWI